MPVSKQILGLLGWLLLSFAAAAIGAVASAHAPSFYADLVRPDWAPPAWLFGPVWTLLYALQGIAAWLVWRARGFEGAAAPLGLFVVQLGANALWSWIFFAWHRGMLAFVDVIVLWLLILVTTLAFGRVRPVAGMLMVPYLLWVSFAAALNFTVWQMNPALLG